MTKYRITNPITEARVKAHIKDSETYEKRLCEAVEKQETSNLSYVDLSFEKKKAYRENSTSSESERAK